MTTTDWQATIRGFTIGRDTNYPGLGDTRGVGPGGVNVRAVPYARGRGAVFAAPVHSAEQLSFKVRILGDTEAETWQRYRALASAWRPAAGTEEVALDVRWPGMAETEMRLYGQPGGLSVLPATLKSTYLEADAEFVADGYWYGAAVTQASAASPIIIGAPGQTGADTDRVTLTIHGNGGTPSLVHSSGGTLVSNAALANGHTLTIDLHAMTVVHSNGGAGLSAASTWFRFDGGTVNTITYTGCASVTVTYRPAYWSP